MILDESPDSPDKCICGSIKDVNKTRCRDCDQIFKYNIKFIADQENSPHNKCECGRYKRASLRCCTVCGNAGRYYVHKNCPTCRCN